MGSKNFILLILLVFSVPLNLRAQGLFHVVVMDQETSEPLVGVTIYFPDLKIGSSTDVMGKAVLDGIPSGAHKIRFSYIGYKTINTRIQFPVPDPGITEIFMEHSSEEIEEIIITSTRSSRTIEDIPTRVEFIAGEELNEKGNMKPGDIRMLLNESTGIQTQQTSASSYNSSIRIQGLDGKYTLLLRDGLPLYSGFSGGLSIMQIAPLDLKQIEVIKGSSSTLYGGGAIAGLVNLVSKTPEENNELSLMVNGTSALGLDVSSFYSGRFNKLGTTLFASYNKGTAYDPADIGLTAIPEFNRFTINPRLFVYLGDTEANLGFNFVTEDRLAGNMEYIKGRTVTNPYFEENKTDRLSSQFQLKHRFNDMSSLELKGSISSYKRSVQVPGFLFSGDQLSSFGELNYTRFNPNTDWVAGLNVWTDRFDQSNGTPGLDLGFSDQTFGAFIQNTWQISSSFTLETGIRADYTVDFGFFPLPRFSLMIKPLTNLVLRLGGGLGYKTPTVFNEDSERLQFMNISAANRENLSAENSIGFNLDINLRQPITESLSFSFNTLLFYTRIDDPLVLVNTGSMFEFQQPGGYTDTKGSEVNIKLSYHDFNLFVGYTLANAKNHLGGQSIEIPLVARHRLNNVLMFERHENIRVGLEAYYFSSQKLSDGTTGDSYWILGLMTEKVFGEHFSVFLNFENFLDTRQTRFDTIYTGTLSNPVFRDIFAPVDGFVINGGFKIKI